MDHIWSRSPGGCMQGSLKGKVEYYLCNNCYAIKVVHSGFDDKGLTKIEVVEPPVESCLLVSK